MNIYEEGIEDLWTIS